VLREDRSASDRSTLWEQRWHPLRQEWVLYTEHRSGRLVDRAALSVLDGIVQTVNPHTLIAAG
jgi:hypothetical protein